MLASSPAIIRMFFRPSSTTCTTWESFTESRLQNGGITFCCTRYSTWTMKKIMCFQHCASYKRLHVQRFSDHLKSHYTYLIFSPTYCQIANCPSSFLLCSKVPLKKSSLKSVWKHLSNLLLKITDSSCQIYKKRMTTCIADSLTDLSQLVYDHRD